MVLGSVLKVRNRSQLKWILEFWKATPLPVCRSVSFTVTRQRISHDALLQRASLLNSNRLDGGQYMHLALWDLSCSLPLQFPLQISSYGRATVSSLLITFVWKSSSQVSLTPEGQISLSFCFCLCLSPAILFPLGLLVSFISLLQKQLTAVFWVIHFHTPQPPIIEFHPQKWIIKSRVLGFREHLDSNIKVSTRDVPWRNTESQGR